MTEQDRKGIYAGWMSTPYPYAVSVALICAAIWFVFLYRGSYSTQGRRVAAFAMALGASCGILIILVIRITWHIWILNLPATKSRRLHFDARANA